jgi:hypothetical protein
MDPPGLCFSSILTGMVRDQACIRGPLGAFSGYAPPERPNLRKQLEPRTEARPLCSPPIHSCADLLE